MLSPGKMPGCMWELTAWERLVLETCSSFFPSLGESLNWAPLLETAQASSWQPRGLVPVSLVSSEIWPCLSAAAAEAKPVRFLESRADRGRRAG